jgi:hypothetical protein
VLPTDPRLANRNEGLVGYDFSCDVVADRRPIIGSPDEKAAKVLLWWSCVHLRRAVDANTLRLVERSQAARAKAEARLAQRYARAVSRLLQ